MATYSEWEQRKLDEQPPTTCSCGSGQEPWWEYDARNIPLCKVCDNCRALKLKHYRPDVLTDPNYWTDEPIDGDEEMY